MPAQKSLRVPEKMKERYEAIVSITDAFCAQHLDDEYQDLCRRMAAALSRKRPSPLEQSQVKSWAAGIVYAVGRVNFLFDRSNEPYMSAQDLCQRIGVSQSTAYSKSSTIWDSLDLMPLHPDWCLARLYRENPLIWLLEVNGFVVDVRLMPVEVQEEAYRLGLIPYVPGYKGDDDEEGS